MSIKTLFVIIITAAFTITAMQNLDIVDVQLLLWNVQMSKTLLSVCFTLFGLFLGLLIRFSNTGKRKMKNEDDASLSDNQQTDSTDSTDSQQLINHSLSNADYTR